MIKDQIISIILGFLAIALVIGTYSAVNYYISRPSFPNIEPKIEKESMQQEKEKETPLGEYKKYKQVNVYPEGLVTPKGLIKACTHGSRKPEKCNSEIASITQLIESEKNIEVAYLYIKAGVSRENQPLGPLTKYDSVWFYLDNSKFGGHLLRSRALINRQSKDGVSELLFDLSQVSFTKLPYDNKANPLKEKDILSQLNNGSRHFIGGFVSTLGYGRILEMKIGYKGGDINLISQ